MTPSVAAAPNIFSAAVAVVLLSRAASPLTASRTPGCTKSAGTKAWGTRGRCLFTTTQGLVGSVRECCGATACEGAVLEGVALGADSTGAGSLAAALGVPTEDGGASLAALAATGDGAASSGVQAANAAIPAPAVRRLAKIRRLGSGWELLGTLDLSEQHAADRVVCVLGEYQLCTSAGGQHIFLEVRLVDAFPYAPCR